MYIHNLIDAVENYFHQTDISFETIEDLRSQLYVEIVRRDVTKCLILMCKVESEEEQEEISNTVNEYLDSVLDEMSVFEYSTEFYTAEDALRNEEVLQDFVTFVEKQKGSN